MAGLHSIGHSNHPFEAFAGLLRAAGVACVADVRSQPYSRRFPQFNRPCLRDALAALDIDYRFLGDVLGGRPADPGCVGPDGQIDYARRAQSPEFQAGMDALLVLAAELSTAMLCAEENPARCHRQLLIVPALLARGVEVRHIRGDGRLETASDGCTPGGQLGLFR